ncbi:MAG: 3-oxoacyl-ACP reductase FabG [Solibacillus sp.]
MRLQNKIAIITGSTNDIGLATIQRFTGEGAQVIILDANETLAEPLLQQFPLAKFYMVNVADEQQVQVVMREVLHTFSRIDILVNNAGITRDAMLMNVTSEQFDAMMDVNVKSVFHCTQAVVPAMIAAGGGRIINTASVVGVYGNIGQTNYAASKAAVIGMTKTWAKELGHKGITVNAVAPGFIQTAMTEKMPKEIIAHMLQMISLGQLGAAVDVANAYVFLASDEEKYITGHTLHVDGGVA